MTTSPLPLVNDQGPAAAGAAVSAAPQPAAPGGTATVNVTSPVAGADIEVDGAFAGSTPTTLQLPAGPHTIMVKSGSQFWERKLQVLPGSNVSLSANFPALAQSQSGRSGYRGTN